MSTYSKRSALNSSPSTCLTYPSQSLLFLLPFTLSFPLLPSLLAPPSLSSLRPPTFLSSLSPIHYNLLSTSYSKLTSKPFPFSTPKDTDESDEVVVLSHDTSPSPLFTYANILAQKQFKNENLIGLESKYSAEPDVRTLRSDLLARVTEFGYVDDYSGVRVDSEGGRFMINKATVWNLIDEGGEKVGQAALFSNSDIEML
ncbi:hypothetical protein TrLO_g6987 [Triparma laevis f. longispina]|uniref:MEKHLA domain-containing protein n=1 Tax=Triparma laevis f. longispina TaxID=1714387 RepID=A0A9W7KRG8_9STRA|nr:hypothetical protein TrLO_g6987 [Triparma laevis f. longispina]